MKNATKKEVLDYAILTNVFALRSAKSIDKSVDEMATMFNVKPSEVVTLLAEHKQEIKAKPKKEPKEDLRPLVAGTLDSEEKNREVLQGTCFIVTSCQNNTLPNMQFLELLEKFAEHKNAQLVIMPFLYAKNKFQNGQGNKESTYFDDRLKPYMLDKNVWLGSDKKVFLANVNILPTVKNPIGGFEQLRGSAETLILPHATVQHKCIATLGSQNGKTVPMIFTTGAVTQKNYIQQKAGQVAETRHDFCALIVEIDEHGQHWTRHLHLGSDGTIYDLNDRVSVSGIDSRADNVTSINYGDSHAEKGNANLQFAQIGNHDKSALNYLMPSYQFFNDTLDFTTLNHHNRENYKHLYNNFLNGYSVEGDLQKVHDLMLLANRDFSQSVLVRSNHDDSLCRWLACTKYNPRMDAKNAKIYYKLQLLTLENMEQGKNDFSLKLWRDSVNCAVLNRVLMLDIDSSFLLHGVEHGLHGHGGANGARGSNKSYSDILATTGHTHSTNIQNGQFVAGVSAVLNQGYNSQGASSWVHGDVILYANGTRTILHYKPCLNGSNKWLDGMYERYLFMPESNF